QAKTCYGASRDDSGQVGIEHPSASHKLLNGETQSEIRTPASEKIRLIPSRQLHCATQRNGRHRCPFRQELILTHQCRILQARRARPSAHDSLSVPSDIEHEVGVLKRISSRI